MAEGFKIGAGYVEINIEDNTDRQLAGVRASVNRWGQDLEREVNTKLKDSFRRGGEDAGGELGKAVERTFHRDGKGRLGKLGDEAGVTFFGRMGKGAGSFFTDAFDKLPGQAKTIGVTAGIIVGAAMAPAVGAAIGGALLAGAAAGPLAIGIMQSVTDPRVQTALDALSLKVGNTLQRSSIYFAPVLERAFDSLSVTWDRLDGQVEETFVNTAPLVDKLVRGVDELATNAMPGFVKASAKAGPVFDQIENTMHAIGIEAGHLFDTVAEHSNEAAAGVQFFGMLASGAISATSSLLGTLLDGFRELVEFGDSMTSWQSAAFGWIPGLGDMIEHANTNFHILNQTANGEGPVAMQTYARAIDPVKIAAADSADRVARLNERAALMAGSMTTAAGAAGTLKAALDQLNGKAISAEAAELAYQAAIDRVTESVKQNGQAHDANSEKGRNNRQVLLSLVQAAQAKVTATYEETLATQGQTAADEAAAAAAAAGREQIIKAAMAMGYSRGEAERYANQLYKIPGNVSTMFKIYGTDVAEEQVQALKDSLNRVPGTKTITIKVMADLPPGISMGYLLHHADGGVIRSYASGGHEQHVAQMARGGAWRMWAEPETGGESYIPHAPSKRARSVQVLRDTNEILGSPLIDPARAAPAAPMMAPASRHYHFGPGSIVVDPSRIRSIADLVALVESLTMTARQFGGGQTAWRTT